MQVVIAVDDSRSMAENGCGAVALEAVTLIARALARLEVGELGVLRFGGTAGGDPRTASLPFHLLQLTSPVLKPPLCIAESTANDVPPTQKGKTTPQTFFCGQRLRSASRTSGGVHCWEMCVGAVQKYLAANGSVENMWGETIQEGRG